MIQQFTFIVVLIIALIFLSITTRHIIANFKRTRSYPFDWKEWPERLNMTLRVAFGQTKIMRRPWVGLMHALVFWGFLVITLGSIEMIIDGVTGKERIMSFTGIFYDIVIGSGDVFALIVFLCVMGFFFRRIFLTIKRLGGAEIKPYMKWDAKIALGMICWLMVSLLGLNTTYILEQEYIGAPVEGVYPISSMIADVFKGEHPEVLNTMNHIYWWVHIVLILLFANILPYSKHFHVFMSIPNVFTARIKPLGYVAPLESVRKEVELMMDPAAANDADMEEPERFGVKDAEDLNWKNYLDSLSCTQCGRCTSVCPANITGKKLSPRKIMMDSRARMKEKGKGWSKEGKDFNDDKSLLDNYITREELWACTMCNACAMECPININQPSIILDMRRYLVLEEASASAETQNMFTNIENNGAPWAFSAEDRLSWTEEPLPLMADKLAKGEEVDYLFWVGSAGAFDERYKKVSRSFLQILQAAKVNFAVLGSEESDSGDVARRSGNELLYQMQAMANVELLNAYHVKKIITCDPHDFNTFKNEYPDFNGNYEVYHHTQFIAQLLEEGKISLKEDHPIKQQQVVFHDPCYLGRANGEYDAPRHILDQLSKKRVEMPRHKSKSLCCGAGGGQMFKEAEKGDREVYDERTSEALSTKSDILVSACPFCMTMLSDGIKLKEKEDSMQVKDIAELVCEAMDN